MNINQIQVILKAIFFLSALLFSINIKRKHKKGNEIINEISPSTNLIQEIINETINYEIEISLINITQNIENINNNEISLEQINRKKREDSEDLRKYNELSDMPKDPNDPLIEKERNNILDLYFNDRNKENIIIFYDLGFPFGNQIAAFNKLLFYCEIIKCKKILLEPDNKMFIQHNIYDKVHDMQIEVYNGLIDGFDYLSNLNQNFFYDMYNLKIENRLDIIKNEIANNLPKISITENDLIIHFRSSDVFQHENDPEHAPDYAQPPLCFYEKIINEFKFEKIYIISIDQEFNPVIKELRKKYPKLIYNENPLEIDLAYLVKGYNIVGSISSFLISSIKLNDNLKFFWEYDRYPMCSKIFHAHYSIFNFKRKFTLYQMEPSETYKNKMIVWQCSKEQIDIMLKDNCPNDFQKIPPNLTKL